MGGTEMSPINGLFNGHNLLTFQGHPEFLPQGVRARRRHHRRAHGFSRVR